MYWDLRKLVWPIGSSQYNTAALVTKEAIVHGALYGCDFLAEPVRENPHPEAEEREDREDLEIYIHGNVSILLSKPFSLDLGPYSFIQDRIKDQIRVGDFRELDWKPPKAKERTDLYNMYGQSLSLHDMFKDPLRYVFTDAQIIDIIRDLLLGLEHMHLRGFAHGDIKSDNILIERGYNHRRWTSYPRSMSYDENGIPTFSWKDFHPRIIDWGFVTYRWKDDKDWHRGGDGGYNLNEVCKHDRRQLDIFRVFGLAYRMKATNYPSGISKWYKLSSKGFPDPESYSFSMEADRTPVIPHDWSEKMREMFRHAFRVDVNSRPTATQWLDSTHFWETSGQKGRSSRARQFPLLRQQSQALMIMPTNPTKRKRIEMYDADLTEDAETLAKERKRDGGSDEIIDEDEQVAKQA